MDYYEMIARRQAWIAAHPGETVPPLTAEELAACEAKTTDDVRRLGAYALSNPEVPVHE